MFSEMAKKLSGTQSIVYLLENQSWELALISSWKQHQINCKVIGFYHTPGARPLDLKLYFDPNIFNEDGANIMPLPDVLAINGSNNWKLIRESGYPAEKVFHVESLRSLNLLGKYESEKKDVKESNRTLLVVTGFIAPETEFQLNLLNKSNSMDGLAKYSRILIKAHPDLPVEKILEKIRPDFKYEITNLSLTKLWPQTDVVYCANSTTACVEAAWLGFPIAISSAVNTMNLNPLVGFPGFNFIASPEILAKELQNPIPIRIPEGYFCLNETLTRWKELFKGLSQS